MRSTQNKFLIIFAVLFSYSLVLAAPTIKVEPKTQNVYRNQKATVRVTTTGTSKCTVTGDTYNRSNLQQVNGNVLLSPTKTVTYLFECSDSVGKIATTSAKVVMLTGQGTANNNTQTTGDSQPPQTTGSSQNNQPGSNPGNRIGEAPLVQYPTQTTQTEAARICQQYSGFKSVYGTPSVGSGGSVPVDLKNLLPVLQSIDKNSRLTANEMRAADMLRFCTIIPNIAAASAKLAQESSKQLKTIADECTADEECYLERVYRSDLEKSVEYAKNLPVVGRDVAQLVLIVNQPKQDIYSDYDEELLIACNKKLETYTPIECINIPLNEQIIRANVQKLKDNINYNQSKASSKFFQGGGVIGSQRCTKTFSGADPTTLEYDDLDCANWKEQPAIINQEVLKQISALPYTQAFSPAAELGVDPAINNISTRIQGGNLIDPNISAGFGSVLSGGKPIGSGGGGGNGSIDFKASEPVYKKLISNIEVITNLYGAAKLAYDSSTTTCQFIPVQTRSQTLEKIVSARKSYSDYSDNIKTRWAQALKTPNENHLGLITLINFDLKEKYNQEEIDKVKKAVVALLQACVDAQARAARNASSTVPTS